MFYLKFKLAWGIVTGAEDPPPALVSAGASSSAGTTTNDSTSTIKTTPARRTRRNATPSGATTVTTTVSSTAPVNPVNLLYSSDPQLKSYIERRNIACQIIYSQCSISIQPLVANEDDLKRMWDLLATRYDTTTQQVTSSLAINDFFNERPGQHASISAYANKLLEFQQNLAGSLSSIPQHILRHQLTAYLPQEYNATVIYHTKSTWDELLKALLDQGKLLNHQRADTRALTVSRFSRSQGFHRGSGSHRFRNRSVRFSGPSTAPHSASKKCFHCGMSNHIARDCRIRKSGLRAQRKSTSNPNHEPVGYSTHNTPAAGLYAYAFSFVVPSCDDSSWLVDSGASDHITANLGAFLTCVQLLHPIPILMGDNHTIHACKIGTVELRLPGGPLTLTNCLYAPELGSSLL